jgi:two-component system response regulator YesN
MEDSSLYKLLIVDDEPIIADSLAMLFSEQQDINLQVFKTYTVVKALEMFESIKPDIVLTDIKMPMMTGVEFVEKIQKIKQDIKVIFLTGYDEFDFAYSAIKQGAMDYILKTEGDEVVIGAVKRAISELEKEKRLAEEYETAQVRLKTMLPIFRQQLLCDIVTGIIPDEKALCQAIQELEDDFALDQNVLLIVGRDLAVDLSLKIKETILLTVENIILYHLENSVSMVLSTTYLQDYLWFVVTKDMKISDVLFNLLLDAQIVIKRNISIPVSFVIASEPVKWLSLNQKYQTLQKTIWECALTDEEGIILENNFQVESILPDEEEFVQKMSFASERVRILQMYLEKGQYHFFKMNLDEICELLGKAKRHSFNALALYYMVAGTMLSYINRNGLTPSIAFKIQLAPLFSPSDFTNWMEGADYLKRLSEAINEVRNTESQANIKSATTQIKEYIISNIASDLTLKSLGHITGFNPAYLSRVFKQYEGIGIHDYISNCRMELAKTLLNNTKLKIFEISEKCGYNNIAYFIKAFKLTYGQSPQEYREKIE